VTVAARPEQIWPWLVQIGLGRAGWYNYDWLDNLGRRSAERIIPEFQHVAVGDLIPLSPDGKQGQWVKAIEPNRWMLWGDQAGDSTWFWGLYPVDERHTRLLTRVRMRYRWTSLLALFNPLVEFTDAPDIAAAPGCGECFAPGQTKGQHLMKILVAVASRHGSTHEIADALARKFSVAGHSVDVQCVEDNPTVEEYDAAVIGSAVYMGKWLPQAEQFIGRRQAQLAAMPVWLFSSGPLGSEDPRPRGDPAHVDQLISRTCARGHRTFVGKLDKGTSALASDSSCARSGHPTGTSEIGLRSMPGLRRSLNRS
jgi:menaquinone-dependent protoporphyrinogen IX oxidase